MWRKNIAFIVRYKIFAATIASGKLERTFCLIKPDGVQRNLIGDIIKRYENKGLKLVALKFLWVNNSLHSLKKCLSKMFRKSLNKIVVIFCCSQKKASYELTTQKQLIHRSLKIWSSTWKKGPLLQWFGKDTMSLK